jgi:hypothetical protein
MEGTEHLCLLLFFYALWVLSSSPEVSQMVILLEVSIT